MYYCFGSFLSKSIISGSKIITGIKELEWNAPVMPFSQNNTSTKILKIVVSIDKMITCLVIAKV